MCGQCAEANVVLKMVEKESTGEEFNPADNFSESTGWDWIELVLYLQETADFIKGLNTVFHAAHTTARYKRHLNSQVILCRTIEVLLKEGFTSETYQKLINNHLVKWAVEKECRRDIKISFTDPANSAFSNRLLGLYDAETYFRYESWQTIFDDKDSLIEGCSNILLSYRDWWLEGKGLQMGDPEEVMKEIGIFDPLDERVPDEVARFNLIFRAVFFSLLLLSDNTDHQSIVFEIAREHPKYVADFVGVDLWLQRKAIVSVLRTVGVKALLPHIHEIRPGLLYYAALKAEITEESRRQLSDSMLSSSYEETRYYAKALVGEDCGWDNVGIIGDGIIRDNGIIGNSDL